MSLFFIAILGLLFGSVDNYATKQRAYNVKTLAEKFVQLFKVNATNETFWKHFFIHENVKDKEKPFRARNNTKYRLLKELTMILDKTITEQKINSTIIKAIEVVNNRSQEEINKIIKTVVPLVLLKYPKEIDRLIQQVQDVFNKKENDK